MEPVLWIATTDDVGVAEKRRGGKYWAGRTRRTTWVDCESEKKLERMWDMWEKDGDVSWN